MVMCSFLQRVLGNNLKVRLSVLLLLLIYSVYDNNKAQKRYTDNGGFDRSNDFFLSTPILLFFSRLQFFVVCRKAVQSGLYVPAKSRKVLSVMLTTDERESLTTKNRMNI